MDCNPRLTVIVDYNFQREADSVRLRSSEVRLFRSTDYHLDILSYRRNPAKLDTRHVRHQWLAVTWAL